MRIFFLVAIISFWVSCKPEPIELEIPQQEPKPVIYNQYITDGYFAIWLTKSFGALENKKPAIDSNGIILDSSIFYENIEAYVQHTKLLELEGGVFVANDFMLQDGENYTLTIYEKKKLLAEANAVKMKKILFDSVAFNKNNRNGSLSIFYRVKDDPNTQNYYVINYLVKKEQDTISNKLDPEYIAKRMLEQNSTFDLLTDNDFVNGFYQANKIIINNYESDTAVVSLSNIDKGFYDFLVTQKRAGKLVNQLKGEVINFPSNILSGYGYFSLHEPDIRIFKLE